MATRQRKKDDRPLWKIANGEFTNGRGKTYYKGDTFHADEFDIPEAFRDIVVPVVPEAPVKKVEPAKPKFIKREIVAPAEEQDKDDYVQMYEVVNEKQNKVVSSNPLTEKEASAFLKDLNA